MVARFLCATESELLRAKSEDRTRMVHLFGCLQWIILMMTSIPNWIMTCVALVLIFLRSPASFFRRDIRSLESFEDPCHLEHEFHKVNGVRLHVAIGGRAPAGSRPQDGRAKPLMLFVHGFPEAWFSWRHQLVAFQSSYEVAAVELRGYGISDKPSGRSAYRMHEMVADLAELIPSLGHESCILVGHDWGASIVWAFAAQHAELVEKLVVLSVPPVQLLLKNMDAAQKRKSAYMWMFQAPLLPELLISAHNYAAIDDIVTGPKMGAKSPGAFSDEDVARYKANIAQPGALTAALNYYRAMVDKSTWNPSPRTPRKPQKIIKIPALVIGGKDDGAINPGVFRGLEQIVPNAELHMLDDCSHWVQQDRPEDVNRLMKKFLE